MCTVTLYYVTNIKYMFYVTKDQTIYNLEAIKGFTFFIIKFYIYIWIHMYNRLDLQKLF